MQSQKLTMSPTQSQPRQQQQQQQHGPKPQVSNTAARTAQTMSDQDVLRRTTRVLRQLYHRERQFLSSLTPAQLQTLTQQDNPSLSEQHHYGEVCFVLLGLKPCALMDYADRTTLLPQYIARVVEPSIAELNRLGEVLAGQQQQEKEKLGEGGGVYPRGFELRCRRIEHQVESPEGGSWQGAYVLYDERQKESRRWAEALLDGARGKVDEDELAQALDYPGSLPKTSDEMRSIVPVSYLGRMKSESGEWMSDRWECLTSFIVLQHELPQMALHRMRYQAIRIFDIEMQVAMDTSSMEHMYSAGEPEWTGSVGGGE